MLKPQAGLSVLGFRGVQSRHCTLKNLILFSCSQWPVCGRAMWDSPDLLHPSCVQSPSSAGYSWLRQNRTALGWERLSCLDQWAIEHHLDPSQKPEKRAEPFDFRSSISHTQLLWSLFFPSSLVLRPGLTVHTTKVFRSHPGMSLEPVGSSWGFRKGTACSA